METGVGCQWCNKKIRKVDNGRLRFMINPDPKLKRALSEKIRRRLSSSLEALGFSRAKTTFWIRPQEHTVEFVHLHLFSFAASFRVHLGIRVRNDKFEAIALNGLHSLPGRYENGSRYNFRFTTKPETIDRCSSELFRFVVERGEPWFHRFGHIENLLELSDSPLNAEEKSCLKRAVDGVADSDNIAVSQKLLGLDR